MLYGVQQVSIISTTNNIAILLVSLVNGTIIGKYSNAQQEYLNPVVPSDLIQFVIYIWELISRFNMIPNYTLWVNS